MHPKSLGQTTDNEADIHSVEERLLLLDHALQILGGQIQQLLKLPDPVIANLSRGMGHPCLVKQAGGFLMVFPRNVEGVFQRCVMFESRFVFHDSILVPFPG
jgi:hypothetical protein